MRAFTILAMTLSVAWSAPATVRSDATAPAVAHAVDRYVAPLLARGDLSGQLLVTRHGKTILERSWGMANAELGVAVSPQTRFNIASVTKPMTVVLAIQQIVDGHIATRDSIARWLPAFPHGDSITVGMLLRHRSGIPHEVVPDSESVRPFTAAEVASRAARLPLDFHPGVEERYSSGGFEVLARVLELASGTGYDSLLASRIFDPLGMSHTSCADSRRLFPGRAAAYVPGARAIENAPLQDFTSLVGAGSVWSDARDLTRFVEAVAHGRLGPGPQRSYAGGGAIDFNGRTGGFKAWAVWDSLTDVAVVMLSNLATGAPDALKHDMHRLVAGGEVPPPALPEPCAEPLTESEARRWEGTYRLENGVRLKLEWHDDALWSNDWVLRPSRDGGLFSPRDYGRIRGVLGTDGRTERIDWEQDGVVYPAPRIAS